MTKKRVVLVVVAVLFLAAAAWMWALLPWSDPYSGAYSDLGIDFDDALGEALASERTVPLSDLTPFEWETLSIFGEATSREEVHAETGVQILRAQHFWGRKLLVFCHEGRVVDVHYYPYGNIVQGTTTVSTRAVVGNAQIVDPHGVETIANCA